MLEHDSPRFRTRRRLGHRLLCVAIGLYVAFLMARGSTRVSDPGWRSLVVTASKAWQLWQRGDVVTASAAAGLVYANLTAGAAAVFLVAGWVRSARVVGLLAVAACWLPLLSLAIATTKPPSAVAAEVSTWRGVFAWLTSVHLVTLAAFVTPRRPRQPVDD